MTSKRRWVAAAVMLAAVTVGVLVTRQWPAGRADEPAPKAPGAKQAEPAPRPEEADIRKIAEAFARAFEKGDAKALGAFFTGEGEYVDDDGTTIHGRAALEKAYTQFFAKRPNLTVTSKTDKVRFLSKDSAIEEGTFTVQAKDKPASTSRYSTLFVREDGKWRMAMVKEWGDDKTNRPDLDDLAWLIGSWETDGPEQSARTTYEWSPNKKFIICKFSISSKKDKGFFSSGTQVIGVDPAVGLIRSWTFSSDGGIGEANWGHDGERWVIDSHATLADGTSTSARNFMARAGDDAITWRSVLRTLEGEPQPDIGMVKIRRVK